MAPSVRNHRIAEAAFPVQEAERQPAAESQSSFQYVPVSRFIGFPPGRAAVYSLLSTFFCQDFLPHAGHFMYLVLPMCIAMNTLFSVGTYRCPQCRHS